MADELDVARAAVSKYLSGKLASETTMADIRSAVERALNDLIAAPGGRLDDSVRAGMVERVVTILAAHCLAVEQLGRIHG